MLKKTVAIALFALGLFGIALFAAAVQMARARMENAAAETVDAVRGSQHANFSGRYRDWPK